MRQEFKRAKLTIYVGGCQAKLVAQPDYQTRKPTGLYSRAHGRNGILAGFGIEEFYTGERYDYGEPE